ncbi:MAG: hypothetical protein WD823_06240, partial [Sulfuricaulis sp.]|uniref:hypothetical protein n=1 Tax=Sulfuricaulis sp. TaxID=2003553 RepID=UPI0034A5C69C
SAEIPGTGLNDSLSFIEGGVVSFGTGEALRDRPTSAITGSEKRGDEGAPLFTVRVDGVVRAHA